MFPLKIGKNNIVVQFKRTEPKVELPLKIRLEVPKRYDQAILVIVVKERAEGRIEKDFIIDEAMPKGFETLMIGDADVTK